MRLPHAHAPTVRLAEGAAAAMLLAHYCRQANLGCHFLTVFELAYSLKLFRSVGAKNLRCYQRFSSLALSLQDQR